MSFYAYNITLKGPGQQEIAEYLTQRKRTAYVSATTDGFTVLSDEHGYEKKWMILQGRDLSQKFHCTALALQNYDDDVLWYELFVDGAPVDEYDSCPDYHDYAGENTPPRGPMGGDATILCRAFDCQEMMEVIDCILRDSYPLYGEDERSPSRFAEWIASSNGQNAIGFRSTFSEFCLKSGCGPKAAKEAFAEGFDSERVRHAALAAALSLPWYSLVVEFDDLEDDCWPSRETPPIRIG